MNLKYRPFAAIGFTVLLSLFIFIYFSDQFVPFFMGIGFLLAIISLLCKSLREHLVPIYVAGSLLISGLVYYAAAEPYKIAKKYVGSESYIVGTVAEEPEYSDSRYYYVLDLDDIDSEKVNCRLRLSLPENIGAEISDVVSVKAMIYEIASDSRDVQIYYNSKGIFLGAYQYNSENVEVSVEHSNKYAIKKEINKIKNIIVTNVKDNIHGERGSTVVAMLLGDKSGLSDERVESFREAGIAPLFAVSGLHLSIWVLGLFDVLRTLGLKKRICSIVSIVFAVFFMLLTGLTPSVCRAGIMMILLLYGNLFYRKTDSVNSLGFVAFLLCTVHPYIATDTGFLLSFSATLGIVTIVPACEKHIFSKLKENSISNILKTVLMPLIVSVSASIAVLPCSVLLIGKVSVFSILSNFILSFIATICMVTGGIGALISAIPYVSDILFTVSGFLSGVLLDFVDWVCSAEVTMVSTANVFWQIGTMVSVTVVMLAVFNFKGKNIIKFTCIGLALDIVFFSLASGFYYNDLTQVRILNVENGVTAVVYNDGEKILLSGKSDEYSKVFHVSETLEYYNQRSPDLFLIADKNALEDKANFNIMQKYNFGRIVLPYANQSLEAVSDVQSVYSESGAEIEVFDNDTINYKTCESYSLALAQFNKTKILFLFDSYKRADIPEEYLDADILVCDGFIPYCIDPSIYQKVIVCSQGENADSIIEYVVSRGGDAQSLMGDAFVINIRNDSYKIFAVEG